MTRPRARMELLAVRSRLGLARQGRELLEQKRDALKREFYREARTVYAAHVELEAAAGAARHALEVARVLLGTDTISAAAADVVGQVNVDVELVTVMGVHVPAAAHPGRSRPCPDGVRPCA